MHKVLKQVKELPNATAILLPNDDSSRYPEESARCIRQSYRRQEVANNCGPFQFAIYRGYSEGSITLDACHTAWYVILLTMIQ